MPPLAESTVSFHENFPLGAVQDDGPNTFAWLDQHGILKPREDLERIFSQRFPGKRIQQTDVNPTTLSNEFVVLSDRFHLKNISSDVDRESRSPYRLPQLRDYYSNAAERFHGPVNFSKRTTTTLRPHNYFIHMRALLAHRSMENAQRCQHRLRTNIS